jgi:hypothetical protein
MLVDTKLTTLLEDIRGISPTAFRTLQENTADIYQNVTRAPKRMMKTATDSDTEFTAQLEAIRRVSRVTYVSLKLDIAATYQSIIAEDMEKTFLNWQTSVYREYKVAPGMEGLLAAYVEKPCADIAEAYVLAAPSYTHATIYFCNSDEIIISRRHLFKQGDVIDVLQTFWEYLSPTDKNATAEIITEYDDDDPLL